MALASLDRRTRFDVDLHTVTPEEFLTKTFPELAERNGALVAAGIRALDAPPLAIELADQAFSFTLDGDTVAVEDGIADGAVVVTLDDAAFSDWAQLQQSFNGMAVALSLQFRDGTSRDVSIWDSLWLALLEGWPVVDDDLQFLDRHGEPLDLGQSFGPDDDPLDIAHFLREAGYLHLRGWMAPELMATIEDEIDRAVPHYTEDDGRSWWAILDDGSKVCVRLQDFLGHSPSTDAMLEGDLWEQLRRTLQGDDELVASKSIEALIKPVGVVKGASDVTFHRDCHLGRHPYGCSGTTVGISVTGSSEANGRLRVVAGSHRVAVPVEIARTAPYLPVVAVSTEPGDLTVHLSCTLHEAQPPVSEPRKVMYAGFGLAPREGDLPEGSQALKELRERTSKTLLADDAPTMDEAWGAGAG
jgi:Phytanoyl-CoA dioxygenase (PhyH)